MGDGPIAIEYNRGNRVEERLKDRWIDRYERETGRATEREKKEMVPLKDVIYYRYQAAVPVHGRMTTASKITSLCVCVCEGVCVRVIVCVYTVIIPF